MARIVKQWFLNIVVLAAGILLFLLGAEVVIRLVMPNTVKLRLMHSPDEKLGYRLIPNYTMTHRTSDFCVNVSINSEGLRDHEYPAKKDRNSFRILALGDSFTMGVGVDIEDTYLMVLEDLLNRQDPAGKIRYEVVNAGVDGYGTMQEYLYLEELLARYQPDLVLVGLYSNDVADVMSGIPVAYSKSKAKNALYILSYLRGLQIAFGKTYRHSITEDVFGIYMTPLKPALGDALRRTQEYLVKIRDLAQSRGAGTLVVLIPLCFELDKAEWDKKGLGGEFTDAFFTNNMTRLSDSFVDFGRANGIPTLALLPAFRRSTVRPLYFTKDPHWTKEGHRLAAETLQNFLRKSSPRLLEAKAF